MASHVEKLIKASAWASLPTPTEKLISVWFAATYPNQPLDVLFKDVPQKEIISGIGSHQRYVKSALGTMAQNTFFIKVYENLCLKRNQVSDKKRTPITHVSDTCQTPITHMSDTCQTPVTHVSDPTKESERERESSPRTPFIEREKGKENTHNCNVTKTTKRNTTQRASQAKTALVDPLVREEFQPVLQQIAESYVPGSDGMVTSGNAKESIVGAEVTLKYPKEFEVFYAAYPNRWGLAGVGYLRLKGYWKQAEEKGWEGPAVLEALSKADEQWQAERKEGKKVFIPNADKFLIEESYLRRYLPAMAVAKMLGAPVTDTDLTSAVTLEDPQAFEEFCEIYPKKRGLLDPKEKMAVAKAWKGCETRGWHPYDILRALKEALTSKSWTENDGRFIPTAEKFLNEEQMRQFLSIGFKPNGGSFVGTKKPITEEEAYWSNLENFA